MTVDRSAWLVAVAVAAVVAVVEAPIVLAGRTWADRAYQTEVVPSRAAAGAAWASGHLPEWWDGTGLGVPLAAEPAHGAMYPALAVVGAAPEPAAGMDLMIVIHAFLAAIGVAVWTRRRGADDIAAVVAGAGLAASGALQSALLAGGLGVAWLPWAAWAAEPDRDEPLGLPVRRTRLRRACALAAFVGLAGLAGPPAAAIDAVIVAIAIAVGGRRRGAVAWAAAACATGALACAAAWLPAIVHRLGDVAEAGARAPASAEWLGWLAPAGAARFHLGAAWLALAGAGVITARHRAAAIAVAAAAVVIGALVAAPSFTAMDPAAHLAALSIVVCALGAAGLDRLIAGLERPAAVALGGAAVVIAAAFAARHAGTVASVGELAALAALAFAWPRAGAPQLAAAVLLVGPALYALRDAQPLVGRGALVERPILAPSPGLRVYRPTPMDPDDPDPAERAKDDHATLAGDTAARFGCATAQTSDPGRSALADPAWRAAGSAGYKLLDRYAIDTAILPATVAQAMQSKPLATRGRWSLVDTQPKRPRAFVTPRVRGAATPSAEIVATFPGPDERGTPLDTIAIAGVPDDLDAPGALTACTRHAERPEQVTIDCPHAGAGWAVVDDAWAPGWSATVDDRDAEVRRADALVRAVHVDAGDHEIAWIYKTPWLRLAMLLSGLAWVHVAFFAWVSRRRRARDPAV